MAAALRIVDAEGVDAVTMRRVGDELGTGGASLYAHIANKEELLDLVFDKVLGDVELVAQPDPRRWVTQLKELATSWYLTLLQHNDLARLGFGDVPIGPNGLKGLESTLAVLRAGKLTDHEAAYAADQLAAYVISRAYEGNIWAKRGIAEESGLTEPYELRLQKFFASLPPDEFPTIVSMADILLGDADGDDGKERFEFGLDVLIRGLLPKGRR